MWLERHRLPEWAASIVLLLAAYLVLFLLTLALIVSVAQLAELLPQYTDQFTAVVADVGNTLKSFDVQQEQINAVVNAIDPGQLVAAVSAVLASTLGVLSNVFFLILLLFFMAFDTDSTRRSVAGLGNRMPDLAAALSSFARGARRYMGITAGFGFIVAVIDGIALQLMGVPGAFVWAVLAFVTNFIPNIGFVIGVIPPAIIALLDGGPGLMLAVIVTYSVVNFLIQSIIQPRVVGDAVGLTALFTFLSLVFWTWVIGPLGALLAVPLTLLARALLVETDPRSRWALPLIAGKAEPTEKSQQPQKELAGTGAK
jgi:AI-2 transport protein TqsA